MLVFVAAPQILILADYYKPLPYVVVTVFCVVSFLLDVFLLPETHGQPLLESMEQFKEHNNNSKVYSGSDQSAPPATNAFGLEETKEKPKDADTNGKLE